MKIRMEVCDLCKKNYPDAKIKYKYRAKHSWIDWYERGWSKMVLCQECLDKIIETVEETKDESC